VPLQCCYNAFDIFDLSIQEDIHISLFPDTTGHRHTLSTVIDDLQDLQRVLAEVLRREGHPKETQLSLERIIGHAQDLETQVRHDITVLTHNATR
jgi:signal recognition particle GTPase